MNSLHLALQNAKEKQSSRKEKTILTLNNNDVGPEDAVHM